MTWRTVARPLRVVLCCLVCSTHAFHAPRVCTRAAGLRSTEARVESEVPAASLNEVDRAIVEGGASYLRIALRDGVPDPGAQLPKGKVPTLVLAGDTLELRPKHVAIVGATALCSAALLARSRARAPAARRRGRRERARRAVRGARGDGAAALLCADAFSGLFHWATDNYGDEHARLGAVIAAFQGRHLAPWTIAHRPFANNVHKICAAVLPLVLLAAAHRCAAAAAGHALLDAVPQCAVGLAGVQVDAHAARAGARARALGAARAHPHAARARLHHRAPFDQRYCILTGVCNAPSTPGASSGGSSAVGAPRAPSPTAGSSILSSARRRSGAASDDARQRESPYDLSAVRGVLEVQH